MQYTREEEGSARLGVLGEGVVQRMARLQIDSLVDRSDDKGAVLVGGASEHCRSRIKQCRQPCIESDISIYLVT